MKKLFLAASLLLAACSGSSPSASRGAEGTALEESEVREATIVTEEMARYPFWTCFLADPNGTKRKEGLPASAKVRLQARTDAKGRVTRCWALREGGNFDKRQVDGCLQRVLPGLVVAKDEAAATLVDIKVDFLDDGYRYSLQGSDKIEYRGEARRGPNP